MPGAISHCCVSPSFIRPACANEFLRPNAWVCDRGHKPTSRHRCRKQRCPGGRRLEGAGASLSGEHGGTRTGPSRSGAGPGGAGRRWRPQPPEAGPSRPIVCWGAKPRRPSRRRGKPGQVKRSGDQRHRRCPRRVQRQGLSGFPARGAVRDSGRRKAAGALPTLGAADGVQPAEASRRAFSPSRLRRPLSISTPVRRPYTPPGTLGGAWACVATRVTTEGSNP
jgi:hypothetical protein